MNKLDYELTIAMPVWNRDEFVAQSIESILNQDFKNFILVISDNGSTDNTQKICEEHCKIDKRIIYIRHEVNLGQTENFQFLIDYCQTKYFMFASSDDLWSENWVSELMNTAKDKNICAIGNNEYINRNGKSIKGINRKFDYSSNNRIFRRVKYIWNLNPLPIYGIYHTNLLKKNWRNILGELVDGVYKIRRAGDIYFNYINLETMKIKLNNNCTRYTRLHGNNQVEFSVNTKKLSKIKILLSMFTVVNPFRLMMYSNFIESLLIPFVFILIVMREFYLFTSYQFSKILKNNKIDNI